MSLEIVTKLRDAINALNEVSASIEDVVMEVVEVRLENRRLQEEIKSATQMAALHKEIVEYRKEVRALRQDIYTLTHFVMGGG